MAETPRNSLPTSTYPPPSFYPCSTGAFVSLLTKPTGFARAHRGLRVRVGMWAVPSLSPAELGHNAAAARLVVGGPCLAAAKALADMAHGGQVLLAGATEGALQQELRYLKLKSAAGSGGIAVRVEDGGSRSRDGSVSDGVRVCVTGRAWRLEAPDPCCTWLPLAPAAAAPWHLFGPGQAPGRRRRSQVCGAANARGNRPGRPVPQRRTGTVTDAAAAAAAPVRA